MWFPTTKGLAFVRPDQIHPNTNQPPVRIESVKVQGQLQNTNSLRALPPVAVQFTKRALNHAQTRQIMDSFEFSMALEQFGMLTDDLKEAVASFKEKRKPVYKNR